LLIRCASLDYRLREQSPFIYTLSLTKRPIPDIVYV
jgi:hypothetical protein